MIGVDVHPGLGVLAAVHEPVVAVRVLLVGRCRSRCMGPAGRSSFTPAPSLGLAGSKLNRCSLRAPAASWESASSRRSVIACGIVVELRRVVDRAEEPRQVVEEGVVAAADEDVDVAAVRRFQRHALVRVDHLRHRAAGEVDEVDLRAVVSFGPDTNLERLEPQVPVLDGIEVVENGLQAPILRGRVRHSRTWDEEDPVQQVGIEHAGTRYGAERERDRHPLSTTLVLCRESVEIVQIGAIHLHVPEDGVDGVRIVVVRRDGEIGRRETNQNENAEKPSSAHLGHGTGIICTRSVGDHRGYRPPSVDAITLGRSGSGRLPSSVSACFASSRATWPVRCANRPP